MSPAERRRFDLLLERVLETLPPRLHDLLEEAPLIVEDRPSRKLLAELDLDPEEDSLCGLHSGTPLTHRSVEHDLEMPETIHLFREKQVAEALGIPAGVTQAVNGFRPDSAGPGKGLLHCLQCA